MARNPPDARKRTTIEWKDRVIYKSDAAWPTPAACFTPDIQKYILGKTVRDNADLQLCVPHNMQPAFWEQVAECCRLFARNAQDQAFAQPSTEQVEKTIQVARRLQIAMYPLLGMYPNEDDVALLGKLQARIEYWSYAYPKRTTKQRNNAARVFIADIGGMFAAAFEHAPSEAPEGPFARFVLACLDETTGLPDKVSGDWVRKYVQEHKNAASRRSNQLWALSEHLAWDDPP